MAALFVEQLVDSHSAADYHVGLYLHAELLHILDLAGEHLLLRKPELRNAVDQYSAGLVQGFENRNVVTKFGKVAGAGKTGWTGTDYRDLLSVRGGLHRFLRRASMLAGPVGDETLQLAYSDRLALDSENAASLALGLLRAYAAANSGKGRITGDDFGSAAYILLRQLRYEIGNLEIHGAGGHTARILAMQAAGGFKKRLLLAVAVAHFIEIGRADLGVLFADRDSRNSVCHHLSLPILHSCSSISSFSSLRYCP